MRVCILYTQVTTKQYAKFEGDNIMTEALVGEDLARILVLEDEPAQLQTITAILEEEGFQVIGCMTCADALTALAHNSIAVAIVDLCLPDLSTLELLRTLERWSEHVPIIVNTAYGSYESAKEALNLGAFAYVEKAGDPEQLVRQVHRAIQERLKQYAGRLEQAVADRTQALEKTNQALRESEERFQLLFEQAPVGYQSLDAQGNIIEVNQAWLEQFGYQKDEVVGRSFGDFLTSASTELFRQRFPKFKQIGRSRGVEFEIQRKDGEIVIVEIDGNVGYDHNGQFKQTHCVLKDVTRQRAAEQDSQDYQQQLKALASELTLTEERLRRSVATALHDRISQSLAMSKVKVRTLGTAVHDKTVHDSLQDIADIISQTLQEARSLTSNLSYPTLNVLGYEKAVEKWLREEIEGKYDIHTEFKSDGRNEPLSEDLRAVLFRSVRELLINVVKHAQATRIAVTISKHEDCIMTEVRDNGVGCDAQAALRQSNGFGLLSIQESLERLGGRLFFTSPGKRGTCVCIEAPIQTSVHV